MCLSMELPVVPVQTPGSSSPGLIKLSYTARHYQSSGESGVLKQGYLK